MTGSLSDPDFSCGRTDGRTNQPKVVQEVLADLIIEGKTRNKNCHMLSNLFERSLVEQRECKGKDDGGDLPFCKGFLPTSFWIHYPVFNNFFVQWTVCTHLGANGVHAAKHVFQGFYFSAMIFARKNFTKTRRQIHPAGVCTDLCQKLNKFVMIQIWWG